MPPLQLNQEQLKRAMSILGGFRLTPGVLQPPTIPNPLAGQPALSNPAAQNLLAPTQSPFSDLLRNAQNVPTTAPKALPAPVAPIPSPSPATATTASPGAIPQAVPAPAAPAASQNELQRLLTQFQTLNPEQKQLLGIGETPEQKTQREALQTSLTRLIDLQSQLQKAQVPSEGLRGLDQTIQEQALQLRKLNPSEVFRTQFMGREISQAGLERETAAQRDPIARGLSEMLMSRSLLAQQQQTQIENIQAGVTGIQGEVGLRQALSTLSAPTALPSSLRDIAFKNLFQPETTPDIKEYNFAKQQGFTGTFLQYQKQTSNLKNPPSLAGSGGALVNTILQNPSLFEQLTPTIKGIVAPQLAALGFNQFGKPLSDTAIKEISQSQVAYEGLIELKQKIQDNQQFVGPISGFTALNPYSKARRVQADIDRVRQRVGKALEGGVLRKEDEEKYKKILATITDTPETATYKIDQLLQDLQGEINIYSSNQKLAGRNVNIGEQTIERGGGTFRKNADGSYTRIK